MAKRLSTTARARVARASKAAVKARAKVGMAYHALDQLEAATRALVDVAAGAASKDAALKPMVRRAEARLKKAQEAARDVKKLFASLTMEAVQIRTVFSGA